MTAALDMSLKTSGSEDLAKLIKKFGERGADAFAGAAYMWATNVMSTSMKLTPVFTGFLRQSRYVGLPTIMGTGSFSIDMGYSAPYAVFVHEIHKRYVVGEWKFLETALNWHAQSAMREIAMWTRKLIETGQGIQSIGIKHPTEPLNGPIHRPHRRQPGETKSQRKKRLKQIAKVKKQRAAGRANNVLRIAAESAAGLAAQREGRRPPRPGRGG